MRTNTFITLIILLTAFATVHAQEQKKETANTSTSHFGEMKTYYMVFLKTGPNRTHDSLTTAKIQEAHLAHIDKLAQEGKLDIAGPFLDKGDLRGIFILNVPTLEEAKKITEEDPAVKAGRLVMEIKPWYSAKGAKLR